MGSPHIFLYLINHPRAVMEMYCGLLLFINSNLILLQLMLRISLTLQASSAGRRMRAPVVAVLNERQVCLPRPGKPKGGPDVRFSTFEPTVLLVTHSNQISWPLLL